MFLLKYEIYRPDLLTRRALENIRLQKLSYANVFLYYYIV